MERLTTKKCGELLIKNYYDEYRSPCFGCESINRCNPAKSPCAFHKALEKLAEYEDLEEQGKLLKLPCTPGQSVWKIKNGEISKCVVSTIKTDESGVWFCNAVYICDISDFGETVFLTREEAEAALKEL